MLAVPGRWWRGLAVDNVVAMLRIGCEQSVVAHQVGARARHQGGEASDKVERLEQAAPGILPPAAFVHPCTAHVGGAVAEWALERVDHQPIAVDAQPLECDGPARDVAAKTLEFVALMVFASQRRVQ